MATRNPTGYRRSQIVLHWFVTWQVILLFVTGEWTAQLFQAGIKNIPTDIRWTWMPIHIVVGSIILIAMIWRLALRRKFGAPPPPESVAPTLRRLAKAVHVLLYADMIVAAVTGFVVYFWLPSMAFVHDLLTRPVFLVLIGLHVAGALWHHFYLKTDVLKRMMKPLRD